jgi:hypothetical protein
MHRIRQELVRDAVLDDIWQEQQEEIQAAAREGRLPWWDAETEADREAGA